MKRIMSPTFSRVSICNLDTKSMTEGREHCTEGFNFIYEGEISYTLLNKWFDNNVVFGTQNNKAVFGTIFCSNPKLI